MPIEILPESDEDTLCLYYTGVITAEDFICYNRQEVRNRIERRGGFNLLVVYSESYSGWEPEAAELNFKVVTEFSGKAKKLAYLNPDSQKILMMKITQPVLQGNVRYFDLKDYQAALAWVKA